MEPDPYSDDRKSIDQWVKEALFVFWPVLGYLGWRVLVPLPETSPFADVHWAFSGAYFWYDQAIFICGSWVITAFLLWIGRTAFPAIIICWPLFFCVLFLIVLNVLSLSNCDPSEAGNSCAGTDSPLILLLPIAFMSFGAAYLWVSIGAFVWLYLKFIAWLSPPAAPSVIEVDDSPGSWDHLRWPEAEQRGSYFKAPKSEEGKTDN